jgi:hypothetical protein
MVNVKHELVCIKLLIRKRYRLYAWEYWTQQTLFTASRGPYNNQTHCQTSEQDCVPSPPTVTIRVVPQHGFPWNLNAVNLFLYRSVKETRNFFFISLLAFEMYAKLTDWKQLLTAVIKQASCARACAYKTRLSTFSTLFCYLILPDQP